MSDYYNAQRTRNLYDPKGSAPFKLSRSKIDLFIECPRCFYFDRRLGVARPPGFPFALNSAVDTLLKKEFDVCRSKGIKHLIIEKYGVDAVPVAHTLIAYKGSSTWVDQTLLDIAACLRQLEPPGPSAVCDYCAYATALKNLNGKK